jgi:hypothetical protein
MENTKAWTASEVKKAREIFVKKFGAAALEEGGIKLGPRKGKAAAAKKAPKKVKKAAPKKAAKTAKAVTKAPKAPKAVKAVATPAATPTKTPAPKKPAKKTKSASVAPTSVDPALELNIQRVGLAKARVGTYADAISVLERARGLSPDLNMDAAAQNALRGVEKSMEELERTIPDKSGGNGQSRVAKVFAETAPAAVGIPALAPDPAS